jgi:NTP pyrophosphatase (non-canonical NTP hydrolase)
MAVSALYVMVLGKLRKQGRNKMFRQKELAEWQKKNFSKGETGNCDDCAFRMLAGMIEELGELAHALLKNKQGIRGITEEQMKEQVGDAFGDVIVYGTQLLTCLGIDAEEATSKAIDEVLKRDWSKDKVTGGSNACHKGGEHEWMTTRGPGSHFRKTCIKCGVICQ